MKPRTGLLAHPFSVAAIGAFTILLVFALWRLWSTEEALRTRAGDNMLWAIAQAQVATQQLDIALGRVRLGELDVDTLSLRYDILLSRLDLLSAGPQQRYITDLGHYQAIEALAGQVRAREEAFLTVGAGLADAGVLHGLLADLARALGQTANRAMVRQWDETGAQLDRQYEAVRHLIVAVIAILMIGGFMAWRMLSALQARQRAQMALLREREIREAYRSFVALVSHQFRTPLSVIDASMQRILRAGGDMPRKEIAERARRVRSTVGGLTGLMQATLDSMKLDGGGLEVKQADWDVAAELEAARARQREATPSRAIEIDIGREVPARLITDPLMVQQILENLLGNAVKYSPATEPVHLRARAIGDRLHITVQDGGIGIPEDEQERLFQPFFRASTSAGEQGAGIGLHLSRRLARVLGGDISFTSRQGVGSTFKLELPLQAGLDGECDPSPSATVRSGREPKRSPASAVTRW